MKAIQVDPDDRSLLWADAPRPEPGPGEVRLKVCATACNRADLLQRRGLYPVPDGASTILGLDASGIVDACGPGVDRVAPGDPVYALLDGGGYAQETIAHQNLLFPIPSGISLTEAAAIPEVFVTAFLNLFLEGDLQPEERVLIHAGASGVGTAAIQLAIAHGCPVFATASSTKLRFLEELGVPSPIDRETQDFSARIRELTDGEGVDLILDPVAADYFERNIHLLRRRGRLVIIGLLSGTQAPLSLGRLLMRRLRVIGSVLRSRSIDEKSAIADAYRDQVCPLLESGALLPVIDRVLPIEEAEAAHQLLMENATIGKVVLSVDPSLE